MINFKNIFITISFFLALAAILFFAVLYDKTHINKENLFIKIIYYTADEVESINIWNIDNYYNQKDNLILSITDKKKINYFMKHLEASRKWVPNHPVDKIKYLVELKIKNNISFEFECCFPYNNENIVHIRTFNIFNANPKVNYFYSKDSTYENEDLYNWFKSNGL